jgi:hypothetical protein
MSANDSASQGPYLRIIEELSSLPVAQLRAELTETQANIARARSDLDELNRRLRIWEAEEQVLAQMLRFRQWHEDGVPGTGVTLQALQQGAAVAREQTISANVLSVVRQSPTPVSPAEVRERLAQAGVDADPSSIRGALRRWVAKDMLIKNGTCYERVSGHV